MKKMQKVSSIILAMVFAMTITLTMNNSIIDVWGKTASISSKSITIPVGKGGKNIRWRDSNGSVIFSKELTIKNKVKSATYSFTSSNKKVATIAKNGGYITGIKAGTATITLKQKLNKKTTVIGTCKVTVKKSKGYSYKHDLPLGKGTFGGDDVDPLYWMDYRNPSAKYTVKSDNSNLTVVEKKKAAKDINSYTSDIYEQHYTAKKAGTYTLKLQETYKNKTTVLKTMTVVVHDIEVRTETVEITLSHGIYPWYNVNYLNTNKQYVLLIKDYDENNLIVNFEDGYLRGVKEGTATLELREGTVENPSDVVIATFTVVVKAVPIEKIELEEEEMDTYVGDEWFYISYDIIPYETSDTITITSSDPEILKVEHVNDDGYVYWRYTPLKEGTVTITIAASSGKSETCTVTVYAAENEEDDAEDNEDNEDSEDSEDNGDNEEE